MCEITVVSTSSLPTYYVVGTQLIISAQTGSVRVWRQRACLLLSVAVYRTIVSTYLDKPT